MDPKGAQDTDPLVPHHTCICGATQVAALTASAWTCTLNLSAFSTAAVIAAIDSDSAMRIWFWPYGQQVDALRARV